MDNKETKKKTATKKAATKKTAVKKTATKTAKKAVKKEPAKKAAVKKTPVNKKVAAKKASSKTTSLTAKVDVGFGNALYIRGDAPGLSWDHGTEMECAASDEWSWSAKGLKDPVEVKVLLNDNVWSGGPNIVIEPGKSAVVEPAF